MTPDQIRQTRVQLASSDTVSLLLDEGHLIDLPATFDDDRQDIYDGMTMGGRRIYDHTKFTCELISVEIGNATVFRPVLVGMAGKDVIREIETDRETELAADVTGPVSDDHEYEMRAGK